MYQQNKQKQFTYFLITRIKCVLSRIEIKRDDTTEMMYLMKLPSSDLAMGITTRRIYIIAKRTLCLRNMFNSMLYH